MRQFSCHKFEHLKTVCACRLDSTESRRGDRTTWQWLLPVNSAGRI